MSLEHALLDRLEKRSLQIAQQENEIHGLRQLVNEKMSINEQLAEQITTARIEREQMQHQISELRTERDRILEVSKTLVPKSALKQAVQEAAELHSEVAKLRAEVPSRPQLDLTATLPTVDWQVVARNLEQTIAGLNAKVAELQGELDKQKTQADSMERQVGGLTRTRLRLEFERDKMKAKLEPLEALYKTLKGWQENDHIIGYGLTIDTAINKATEALSQLTA